MDGAVVQRLAAAHAQEAGGLLERLRPQPAHPLQRRPAGERALALAVLDDPLRQRRAHPGHVLQQLRRRRVHVHADRVDARVHHLAELLAQRPRVHVVLVLADADAAGVDLDQLRQRVLQPAADRDRAAQRHVQRRQLVPRHVRRRVDGRALLADRDDRHRVGLVRQGRAHEPLRLAAARAVADRDQVGPVAGDQVHQDGGGPTPLALAALGVQRRRLQDPARLVERGQLDPGPQPGVEGDDAARAGRGRQQQVAEVLAEDLDRGPVGALLQLGPQLRLQRGRQQALPAVAHRRVQLAGEQRRRPPHHPAHQRRRDLLVRERQLDPEHPLRLAPERGEDAVRGGRGQRLLAAVVVLELRPLAPLRRHHVRPQLALPRGEVPRQAAQRRALGHPLGADVAGAGQRGSRVGDAALRVHERRHRRPRVAAGLLPPEQVGQRLQAALAGDGGPRPPLRPVGEVQVLQLGARRGAGQGAGQLGRHLALLLDRGDHGRPAGLQLAPAPDAVQHRLHLDLVQAAGRLLAVARDERHGRAVLAERQGALDLSRAQAQLPRDLLELAAHRPLTLVNATGRGATGRGRTRRRGGPRTWGARTTGTRPASRRPARR